MSTRVSYPRAAKTKANELIKAIMLDEIDEFIGNPIDEFIGNPIVSSTKNVCSVCRSVALHRCSSCKTAIYCSETCQKSHWKAHRTMCKYISKTH